MPNTHTLTHIYIYIYVLCFWFIFFILTFALHSTFSKVHGPFSLKTLGGDEYLIRDWTEAPNLIDLAVAQHPELNSKYSFEIISYKDVIVDLKINTLSRSAMLDGKYGFKFIVLFHDAND